MTEFKVGDRVKSAEGRVATVVGAEPDIDGDIAVINAEGRYTYCNADRCTPIPTFPERWIAFTRLGVAGSYSTEGAARGVVAEHGGIGILHVSPDGTTEWLEL